ncbi:MAG: phage tail sheath family protein [Acidobacteriaceae bacterium]|nr:phage tail sheath family protein [Acidobacteriaceae bacterium]MBV9295545.1 phage tail sheath family protein [Acidobacteriaceae bacterium]MBV9764987.1 phage tail sheath family protein [Acidobacteriaceae bacterium]
MPPVLNYPGVYIEELPSAVHTITGVATSIAAFVGWAPKGPGNRAVLVLSFSDFQTQFGGLDPRSYLGYAVNQFFANGGQQAYIVRILWDGTLTAATGTTPSAASTASATVGGTLKLWASSPGQWGTSIQVSVTTQASGRFGVQVLQVNGTQTTILESFYNLSINSADPQYVINVIDNSSQYITFIDPTAPGTPPAAPGAPTTTLTPVALTGTGLDGSVLNPLDGVNGDGNFEIALGSDPTATGNQFGVHLLDRVDIFNLLCVPGETDVTTVQHLQTYCDNERAFYIVDSPQTATVSSGATNLNTDGPLGINGISPGGLAGSGALTGNNSDHSAYYFPWVLAPDPAGGNIPRFFPPCGFIAGIYASTDADRGVWKAPAGIDAGLSGVSGLQYVLTDLENGVVNVQGVNCLRQFKTYGDVVWGARTLQGSDAAGSQWKYVPIRRLALFLESSLYEGTQWVVFEPNDETLWGQIRLNVGAFMQGLFLQGAFQGTSPQQAYFVKCDSENNPQASIDQGIVNILVGFAPLYPAEFVVIQIQQMAGQV